MSDRDPRERPPHRRPGVPPRPPERPGSSVFDQPTAPRHPSPEPYRPPPTREYPAQAPSPGPPTPPIPTPATRPYQWPEPHEQPSGGAPPRRRPPQPDQATQGRDRHARRDSPRGRTGGRGLPFGLGFLVGAAGLGAFLAALLVLPWFSAGGQEVTLSDIRSAFTIPATDPDDLPGSSGDQAPIGDGGLPSPDEVSEAVEQQVRETAAEAAAAAIDTGKARYLELYVDTLWAVAAVAVTAAVVFSTVLTPRSSVMSLLLGLRRLSGVVTVLAGVAHGAALWVVFGGDGSPDPALGVWLGLAGLGGVLVGAIVGPRR